MEAGRARLSDIFRRRRLLEIPYYQRSYVWGEEEWSQFLDDMEYVSSQHRSYFIGSIILKAESHPHTFADGNSFNDRWMVVDGQQRLSTLLIFMKAMLLLQDNDEKFSDYRLNNNEMMLMPSRRDAGDFKTITTLTEAKRIPIPKDESPMIHAFNYFIDNIKKNAVNKDDIEDFIEMVSIEVTADEDEQQIFDTINSRGVQLTTAELLKNYFFSKDNANDFDEYWDQLFEKDTETQKYWNQEVVTGRLRRTLVDLFFDSFLQIKVQDRQYSVTTEDKKRYARVDQLFRSYKDFISHYYKGSKGDFVRELKPYAELFRQCIDPDEVNQSMPSEASLDRINVLIFGLQNSTLIPYVLYLCKEANSEDERNAAFQILENYLLRRIATKKTTKNYNRLFTSLILNEVKTAKTLSEFFHGQEDATTMLPSDDEVKEAFVSEDGLYNLNTKGILYFIESRIRPVNSSTLMLGLSNYSLEHLMPKNWRRKWNRLENEEAEQKRDRALYTMGNLAIITQSLNASIRDADWSTKKAGKASKAGLAECSAGLATMRNVLEKEVWDEDCIAKRGKWLGEKAVELWTV